MLRASYSWIAIVAVLSALAGNAVAADCDPSDTICEEEDAGNIDEPVQEKVYPPYHGPKQVIAVLPFENKVKNVYGSWELGEGLSEILITELIRSNRFVLVERVAIQKIVQEQTLGMSGLVRKGTAPKAGVMSGAQFMVIGAITEFNDQAGGGGLSIGYKMGQVGAKFKTAHVGIDVRIVDNATGQIYASYNATTKARSAGGSLAARVTHNSNPLRIGGDAFFNTALGQATRKAVQKVVGFILQESRNIPWQGSVVKSGRRTFLNRGSNANVKVGDQLQVYAKGEPLIDPETGFNLGSEEELLCSVTVSQVKEKFSVARPGGACAGKPIKRGDVIRYPSGSAIRYPN